jgi:hypothetical protein
MERIQFENKQEITKAFFRSMRKLSQKRSGKLRLWLNLIVKVWFALATTATIAVCVLFDVPELSEFAVAFAALFSLLFILPEFLLHKRFKGFSELTGNPAWIQTVRFGEKIETESGNAIASYGYDRLRYIEENDECFYLWIGSVFIMVLHKNAFTIGNQNEFLAFINEKCADYEPLWTKKQLNFILFKKRLLFIILLVIMTIGVSFYLWGAATSFISFS